MIARFGGEGIVLLLTRRPGYAAQCVEAFAYCFLPEIQFEGCLWHRCTFSAGRVDAAEQNWKSIIHQADQALYCCKEPDAMFGNHEHGPMA